VFYVDVSNWNPFAPHGVSGILKGVSAVFFAYIGFDAISTTAEECKNPQRDLPRGMMWSIIICTILYVAIALILTGIVKSNLLDVGDPLAFVFEQKNLKMLSGVIAISAVIAMASVLLVFQMGQPRIWMSMSRDGLLPKAFSRIHPKYKSPSFATVVTGFVVALPSLFMNLTIVTDLCSIGTLFAFVLVCAGVLVLQNQPDVQYGKFRTPYINSKYIVPALFMVGIIFQFTCNKEGTSNFIFNKPVLNAPINLITSLSPQEMKKVKIASLQAMGNMSADTAFLDLEASLSQMAPEKYQLFVDNLDINHEKKYESGLSLFRHKVPLWIFFISCIVISYFCFTRNLSLIPVLGLGCCLYMMSELGVSNWIGFGLWLVVGLVVYFSYGYHRSKLNTKRAHL
jgi:amino acid transporter